jgi:hypothetical protein
VGHTTVIPVNELSTEYSITMLTPELITENLLWPDELKLMWTYTCVEQSIVRLHLGKDLFDISSCETHIRSTA